jgi:hypothetical protein
MNNNNNNLYTFTKKAEVYADVDISDKIMFPTKILNAFLISPCVLHALPSGQLIFDHP